MICAEFFSEKNVPCFFIIYALIFGTLFFLLTPPFQSPDEPSHFFRAYQVSEGIWHVGQTPREVPKFITQLPKDYPPMTGENPPCVTLDLWGGLRTTAQPDVSPVVVSTPADAYAPTLYTISALGIHIAKLCHLSPLALYYAGRLANFLFWIGISALALRIAPAFRWELFFLSLFPIALFQATSVSADVFNLACSALLFSIILSLCFGNINSSKMIFCVILIFLVAFGKQIYAFSCFLLIFTRPYMDRKKYAVFLLMSGIALAAGLTWPLLNKIPVPSPDIFQEHLKDLTDNIMNPFILLYHTIFHQSEGYIRQLASLGWLNVNHAPLEHFYKIVFYFMILAGCWNSWKIRLSMRVVALAIFLLELFILSITMYLTWYAPKPLFVGGMQGRYILAILPLLLLVFAKQSPGNGGRAVSALLAVRGPVLALSCCIGLTWSAWNLLVFYHMR